MVVVVAVELFSWDCEAGDDGREMTTFTRTWGLTCGFGGRPSVVAVVFCACGAGDGCG